MNSLQTTLTGKIVLFHQSVFQAGHNAEDYPYLVTGGKGAVTYQMGQRMDGYDLDDGEACDARGEHVDRIIEPSELTPTQRAHFDRLVDALGLEVEKSG